MQWLEPILALLSPSSYDILVTLAIAALAIALAMGAGWGAAHLPQPLLTTRRGLIVVAIQVLFLLSGLVGIITLVGLTAAGILSGAIIVVLSGAIFYRPNLVIERFAIFQNQRLSLDHSAKPPVELINNDAAEKSTTRAMYIVDGKAPPQQQILESAAELQTAEQNEPIGKEISLTSDEAFHPMIPPAQNEEPSVPLSASIGAWLHPVTPSLTKRPIVGKRTVRDLRKAIR